MTTNDSRLDALRSRYHASLAGKRADIEQAWIALRADCADAHKQEILLRLIHRLAGSAESYGFQEIGRIAAQADLRLDHVRSSGDSALRTSAVCAMLDALARDIEALIDEMKRGIDSYPGNPCTVA